MNMTCAIPQINAGNGLRTRKKANHGKIKAIKK
jgi:hypothetical protein